MSRSVEEQLLCNYIREHFMCKCFFGYTVYIEFGETFMQINSFYRF